MLTSGDISGTKCLKVKSNFLQTSMLLVLCTFNSVVPLYGVNLGFVILIQFGDFIVCADWNDSNFSGLKDTNRIVLWLLV